MAKSDLSPIFKSQANLNNSNSMNSIGEVLLNHSAEKASKGNREKHVGRIDETPTRDVPSRKRNVELA